MLPRKPTLPTDTFRTPWKQHIFIKIATEMYCILDFRLVYICVLRKTWKKPFCIKKSLSLFTKNPKEIYALVSIYGSEIGFPRNWHMPRNMKFYASLISIPWNYSEICEIFTVQYLGIPKNSPEFRVCMLQNSVPAIPSSVVSNPDPDWIRIKLGKWIQIEKSGSASRQLKKVPSFVGCKLLYLCPVSGSGYVSSYVV